MSNGTMQGNYQFKQEIDPYLQDKKNEYDALIMRLRHLEKTLIAAGVVSRGVLKPARKDR